jgi:hypothetical protein
VLDIVGPDVNDIVVVPVVDVELVVTVLVMVPFA